MPLRAARSGRTFTHRLPRVSHGKRPPRILLSISGEREVVTLTRDCQFTERKGDYGSLALSDYRAP